MKPERWMEIGQLFEQADTLPERDRTAFLDRVSGHDPDLRATLETLLSPRLPDDDPIARIVGDQATTYVEPIPERVGRYRIVRVIGHGGMGMVYEAVRVDDFRKRVALKLVRTDLRSDAFRARFEQERQLLANLDHPFIARLLDGGQTPSGGPYLVLDYVEGEPFLEHCERLHLAGRLRVFLKVCEAVDHAHRNLVIHRDLKPTNILVTADGDPKLLDFGIARLVEADPQATQTEVAAFTPAYASPEQIRKGPMAVASDVYSLGVILYRLLTGRAPYDLAGASAAQVERIICETPPAPPRLDGDLDSILLMALRKEPERRYAGARELAEDIERYLRHQPVHAKPDTLLYRARKFTRRNWPSLVAAGLVSLAVAAGTGATLWQAQVARARFTQLRDLAHAFVFDYADDLAKIQGTTAVRERMTRTALAYLDGLSRSAGGDVALREELAAAYQKVGDAQGFPTRANLGHVKAAEASYAKAAALWNAVVPLDPKSAGRAADFFTDYAHMQALLDDPAGRARSTATARGDLEIAQKAGVKDPAPLAHVWCVLADFEDSLPRLNAYRQCVALTRRAAAYRPGLSGAKNLIEALSRLEDAQTSAGFVEDSVATLGQARQIVGRALAENPRDPELRRSLKILEEGWAVTCYNDTTPSLGDIDGALAHSRIYLDIVREDARRDPDDAASRFSLAVALFRLSVPLKHRDPGAAVTAATESVGIFDHLIADGGSSPLVASRRARAMRRLAEALMAAGNRDAAAPWADRSLDQTRRSYARTGTGNDEASALVLAMITKARVDAARGLDESALKTFVEAEAFATKLDAKTPGDPSLAVLLVRARQELAACFRGRGDVANAVRWTAAARMPWRGLDPSIPYVKRMLADASPLPS